MELCTSGIGTSAALGGTTQSAMHCDGMMYAPTLLLDGRPIVENGQVVEPAMVPA